jgi:hypothetical protein
MTPIQYERALAKYHNLIARLNELKDELRVCDSLALESRILGKYDTVHGKLQEWLSTERGQEFNSELRHHNRQPVKH